MKRRRLILSIVLIVGLTYGLFQFWIFLSKDSSVIENIQNVNALTDVQSINETINVTSNERIPVLDSIENNPVIPSSREMHYVYADRLLTDNLGVESDSYCEIPLNVWKTTQGTSDKITWKWECWEVPTFVHHDRKNHKLFIDKDVCEGNIEINWVDQEYYQDVLRGSPGKIPNHVPLKEWEVYDNEQQKNGIRTKGRYHEVVCEEFKGKYHKDGPNYRTTFIPPSKEAIEKAKEAVRKISKEKYAKSSLDRPPSILVLGFEAVTRAQFFRENSLPLTAAIVSNSFFCQTNSPKEDLDCTHRSFVFNRYGNYGHYTSDNLVPLFSGEKQGSKRIREKPRKEWRNFEPKKYYREHVALEWIWEYGRKLGYISSDGGETKNGFGSAYAAQGSTDARMANLPSWSDGWIERNLKSKKGDDGIERKTGYCLGDTFGMEHMLNYIRDYWNHPDLKGLPLWGHFKEYNIHGPNPLYQSNAIDELLSNFLREFLREHPLTFVLMYGDHGYSYKRKGIADELEAFTPLLLILAPSALLDEEPKIENTMLTNMQRMLFPGDVHNTFGAMMNWPDVEVGNIVKDVTYARYTETINILHDISPVDRKCQDINVEKKTCLCWELHKKTYFSVLDKEDFSERHYKLGRIIIDEVNRKWMEPLDGKNSSCWKVTFGDLVHVDEKGSKETLVTRIMVSSEIGPSIWEGVFEGNKLVKLIQITRYYKYRFCKDPRVDQQFCVCEQFPPGTH